MIVWPESPRHYYFKDAEIRSLHYILPILMSGRIVAAGTSRCDWLAHITCDDTFMMPIRAVYAHPESRENTPMNQRFGMLIEVKESAGLLFMPLHHFKIR